jgi:hypothetical protein
MSSAYSALNAERDIPYESVPLDNISVCAICAEDHKIEDCPSLPGLQPIFKGGEAPGTQPAPKKPWQPRASECKCIPRVSPTTFHLLSTLLSTTTTAMELAKLATTKCPCSALVPGMEKSKLWIEPTAACSTSASKSIYTVSSKLAAIIARFYSTSITAVTAWFYSTFLATHSTKPATVSESTTTYHLARSTHSKSEPQTTPTTS